MLFVGETGGLFNVEQPPVLFNYKVNRPGCNIIKEKMLQAEHVCSACKDACIIVITGIIKLCVLLFRLE